MRTRIRVWAVLLLLANCASFVLLPKTGWAQETDIDAAITESRSGASMRELQAQAGAQPPKTDDRRELAIFYHKRGIANQRLGNYSRAVEDLRVALENSQTKQTADDWGYRWRVQNDLGSVYMSRGDWFSAIDLWKQTGLEYEKSNFYLYHYSQLELMNGYGHLGMWADADAARREADATLEKLRAFKNWPLYGLNALDRNNYHTALFFLRQGNRAEGERRMRASLDWAGKYVEATRKAFPEGHQERRIAEVNRSGVTRELADVLSAQGKHGEAEILARAGLQEALRYYAFNTAGTSYALVVVGWSRFQQGDIAGAEKYYRHALAAMEGSGVAPHATSLASRRAALANALLAQGRWSEALTLFDERDRGLRSDEAQFKRYGSNHLSWAYAVHKSGQSQHAAQMAGRLVASQLKSPVPEAWALAQRRGVLAMALAGSGKTTEALKAFQQSIPDLVRRDQDDVENTGYWRAFWQRAILEAYLDLLGNLHAAGSAPAGLDLVDEAFRIADMARGSSVQEAIGATAARAQLPNRDLAELARKEHDTLYRVIALNQLLARLAVSAGQDRVRKVTDDMRAEIERLRGVHAELRADIRKRYPEYADLIDPRPAGIAEVRKALAPGEAVVSIYLGESQSYVWTLGIGGAAVFRIVAARREEVESDVRELRKAVDFGDGNPARLRQFDLARAHKLYRAFFEPDEALWKGAQVLNVIPHGALGQLPMTMLVTAAPAGTGDAAYRDAPWLVRKVALAQLPSASAFTALRRAPASKAGRQAFVGFGDPMFAAEARSGVQGSVVRSLNLRKVADRTEEQLRVAMRSGGAGQPALSPETPALSGAFSLLNALPDTSDELREIALALKADPGRDVFLTRQATEKNVKQGVLENRRVIVFATHGIAAGELTGLDQPALALSNPALTGDTDNDGFLTMEEVLALKLDADWVVLSACNTASADGRGSEAVSGLGRAFFYAGARSLLVSNWAVETTSARLLTTELFKRQAENPRLTRAEALRQSMLDLMGKKAPGGFSYAHPAFWAPFSLVGDGRR